MQQSHLSANEGNGLSSNPTLLNVPALLCLLKMMSFPFSLTCKSRTHTESGIMRVSKYCPSRARHVAENILHVGQQAPGVFRPTICLVPHKVVV